MRLEEGVKTGVNILRFLALLVIIFLLIPRLVVVCGDLYRYILNERDRVPYGNPMKVEVPYAKEQVKSVVKFNQQFSCKAQEKSSAGILISCVELNNILDAAGRCKLEKPGKRLHPLFIS